MVKTDKSLIDAHIKGDTTAFGEIVRRYGDGLLGYLTRMTGSVERAEDLFQETFKRVHEKADTFRGNRIKSWLFAIATNVAIDGFRKNSRLQVTSLNQKLDCDDGEERELGAVAVADNSYEPSQKAIMSERKEQVRQALELLPAKQRATLVLAYYQQLSYPEVAQALDCSVGTVKTQMYRALKTLAQRLPDISKDTK
ncbi:MAG: sigma-70 family RNA polymerase sigma factor [Phycisphaerae bacterium]|nr:RNA polymerase sigma factor [Phycisphaerae bacterium]NIP54904.1 RNA polymerase sigma factor [Phycisphaerae bacterium]NIS53630.1 RNA polymerase sigma factor [Phycisphaerae bacterium]NIU11196.1 RNA polymerase sigma factor [Phycisphaerae bacterium]NIU59050.1 sigma-70 family RNA polymerase sigma factor [Phycisphaerae bacterium]